jgi:succinate-acetate transporter protein
MDRGDPQILAAPVFTIGSIALGMQLVGYAGTPLTFNTPLAIIAGCTGLFLIISTFWAAYAGQSFVAAFAGTFGAFWIAYFLLVMGVLHDWFAYTTLTDPRDIGRTIATFAIAFAAFFFIMTLVSLLLPIVYTIIIGLVTVALCLVAAAVLMTPIDEDILKVAGYVVLVFAGFGLWLSWTRMNLSLGGPAFPPLGPAVMKPKAS